MTANCSATVQEETCRDSLAWAHPLVKEWFVRRFGTPTEPQIEGWPHILAGSDTLISAPTGSGKTLTAFLACLDRLVRKACDGLLENRTEVVYVSPLKALSNDIQKNLEGPLAEICALAKERGIEMAEIRTAVRTGDTAQNERQKMLRKPPHILVTTPESLYILLTTVKGRLMLADIETVIVDEIHAIADDKRGAHLALSLARLDALVERKIVRIGLSATQKPIELVAEFLTGSIERLPHVVQVGHKRQLDLCVEVPASPLGAVASNEMWDEIYDRIAVLAKEHRSTLVFVNTRRLAERVAHHLGERLGEENVATHHGSLSRKLRHDAEHKLKTGEIRLLVATASLELGIDIGTVDLVCQISSPRSIATTLQRIGRAGHWRGAIPKGRIFATTRDQLVECAACVHAIYQSDLDRIIVPEAPLDILAQQIVASCAAGDWQEDDLYAMVRRAYPYRDLERKTFDEIVEMLSEGFQGRHVRFGSYLHRDRINGRVKGKRGARIVAVTSGGAIPENADFAVVAEPEAKKIGTLDEDFSIESNRGDIVLLGNTSWRIRRVESFAGRVIVEDAHGAAPSVPFWRGEAPARTEELSSHVAELRKKVSDLLPDIANVGDWQVLPEVHNTCAWLKETCGLDDSAAEQLIEYVLAGRSVLGAVPTQKTVIAERFFDEGGGMQLVIHAPFGGRINKAWGLALRKRFCAGFNFELQAAATDDGLIISLSEQHSFPLSDVFYFLNSKTVQHVLEQASLQSPVFTSRFRWDATRALSVLRFQSGKKVPPQLQRMRAEDLLSKVFPDAAACQDNIVGDVKIPDHPLVNEVMKDVLQEAMDLEGLKRVLDDIASGKIETLAVDSPVPSAFSHEIINSNPYAYLDDAPLEERRARAVEMRRVLPETMLNEIGRLDPAAIAQVVEEAWPDVRDADELHDALQTLIAIPVQAPLLQIRNPQDLWSKYFADLKSQGRAALAKHGQKSFWVSAERKRAFALIFPDAEFDTLLPDITCPYETREESVLVMVKGWLMHLGPVLADNVQEMLDLTPFDIETTLLKLESSGQILRGTYTDSAKSETEWCERRLLARIHKLTVGALRKLIEPISSADFMVFLANWQHIATPLAGERGMLEVLKQLQGFEAPANSWESAILSKRLRLYDPAHLDKLCLSGAVGWGRLSPHPATILTGDSNDSEAINRRVIPTSNAPITFFVRDQSGWMSHNHGGVDGQESRLLSHPARLVLDILKRRGACFFADIVRGAGILKSEIETALWELVTAGLVTADGFDNLRSLIDPKRRAGQGRSRMIRPRNNAGRWALLYGEEVGDRFQVAEACCWLLLARYGVVFRDLLARETVMPKWRELLIAFRRLEDRGEIRGGRFVSGFLGEQFAAPYAVESMRLARTKPKTNFSFTVSAADPLNLSGIIVPGERVGSNSSRSITFNNGMPVN